MDRTTDIEVRRRLRFPGHDGVSLSGDYYAPAAAGTYPALVALHGGAWKVGAADAYRHWGPFLARRGYVLFSVDYRLVAGEANRYPVPVRDARAAVRFLRASGAGLRVDPERIGLVGDSAGAHLASMVALAGDAPALVEEHPGDPHAGVSDRVGAVVAVYGVYDLLAQWAHDQVARPRDQITEAFLGTSPVESKRAFQEASPLTYTTADRNHAAFLVVWGTADDVVEPASQSAAFVVALKQAGFFVRTVVLEGAPHFWMWDPLEEIGSHTGFLAPRMLRFLAERL